MLFEGLSLGARPQSTILTLDLLIDFLPSHQVYVIGALPLNTISRAWGYMNNLTLPMWFRPYGFRLYAWIFGCNLDEMKDTDLTHYSSLGEFFYRELREGARPIQEAVLVSVTLRKIGRWAEAEMYDKMIDRFSRSIAGIARRWHGATFRFYPRATS